MRIIRTICAPALVLAIPAFIAFQIAARPMVSCGKNACELMVQIMPCMMQPRETADEPQAEMGGCCKKKEAARQEPVGCGKSVKSSSPCGGCAGMEPSEPVCAESHAADDQPTTTECPEKTPLCGLCPLIPVAAEPAAKPRVPDIRVQVLPAIHCLTTLAQTFEGPWETHSHAPPTTILARAGPDRRVDFCSFLL